MLLHTRCCKQHVERDMAHGSQQAPRNPLLCMPTTSQCAGRKNVGSEGNTLHAPLACCEALGNWLSAQLTRTQATRPVSHRASTDGTCTPCTPAGCQCTRCKCRRGQMTQRLPAAWNPKWDSPVPESRPPRRCHLSHVPNPSQSLSRPCPLTLLPERERERERESERKRERERGREREKEGGR